MDGNKRTAVRTVYAFLRINGRDLVATSDEIVEITRDVAAGEYEIDEITGWFAEHTEAIDET